ncbi:MAG: hypothetical protein E7255_16515 [Lachnospiraceae bacterium]|nr:hypothetical protein [Lachnospiraceae bacterium]
MATKSTSVKATLKITSFIIRLLMNIMFYILVAFLIATISREAFQFAYQLYGPVAMDKEPGKDIIFQIKKGESSMDIASKLERNRVIANKYSFYVKTKLQDADIMAGTYEINSSMTYGEILDIISDYSKSIVQDPNVETNKDEAGKDAKADKGEAEKDTKASKDESSKDAKTDKSESKKNTKTKKDKSNK